MERKISMKKEIQHTNFEQASIFDSDVTTINEKSLRKHNVTFIKRLYSKSMTYEELFEGFEEIYIITYSHSLRLIQDILPNFEKVKIILGNPKIIKDDTLALMAYQEHQMKELRKTLKKCNQPLLNAIEDEKLKFYIPIHFISHEKLFLLRASDGRTRIIDGSANFSEQALNSGQRENINCEDDSERFEELFKQWVDTMNDCTTQVSPKALLADNESGDDIPILDKVINDKIPLILNEEYEDPDVYVELSRALTKDDLIKFKKEHKELFQVKRKNQYIIQPESVQLYQKRIKKAIDDEKKRKEIYPSFLINYSQNCVKYNDKTWDLNANKEDVLIDIQAILNYFKGFDAVEGNSYDLQRNYFKVLNYMFLSPFLAKLRLALYKVDKDSVGNFYPMFLVLWGSRSTGKSHFIEMCQQCMFDHVLARQSPDYFTKTGINTLLGNFKGVPILVDEVKRNNFFNNIQQICKGNDIFLEKGKDDISTVVITSNEIGKGTINQDISKRVIILRFNNAFTFENTYKSSKQIMNEIKRMHNSFYKEYLKKMIPLVNKMSEDIQYDKESQVYPDIFSVSSQVILKILKSYEVKIPVYFTELSHQDYMGDKAVSTSVLEDIEFRWHLDPSKFHCKRRKNLLEFEADSIYEARKFAEELPKDMQAIAVGNSVFIKNLSVAEKKYFGFSFKKKLFGKK